MPLGFCSFRSCHLAGGGQLITVKEPRAVSAGKDRPSAGCGAARGRWWPGAWLRLARTAASARRHITLSRTGTPAAWLWVGTRTMAMPH